MSEDDINTLRGVFSYDESSPSCIVWKINYYVGNPRSILRAWPGKPAGCINQKGYYKVKYKNLFYGTVHRLIWLLEYGNIQENCVIDHINGVKTDNRLSNLRCVPLEVNMRNIRMNSLNTSGENGVCSHLGRYWKASWYKEGKLYCKYFSIVKLGNDEAFNLACIAREELLQHSEKEHNITYSDRHGK